MSFDVLQSQGKSARLAVPFPPSSWECVLKLMGLVIVVDKKTFKEEVDAFIEAVIELRDIIDPTIFMTGKKAYDWFKLNKPALDIIIDDQSYDTALCEIIEPIMFTPYKLDVISRMVRIAVSDGQYCDLEKSLIKKTCLYWDVRSQFQHTLEHIFTPSDLVVKDKIVFAMHKYPSVQVVQTAEVPDSTAVDRAQRMKSLRSQGKQIREYSTLSRICATLAREEARTLRQNVANMIKA